MIEDGGGDAAYSSFAFLVLDGVAVSRTPTRNGLNSSSEVIVCAAVLGMPCFAIACNS
nr:hypothetical protein [Cohnella faecalis]